MKRDSTNRDLDGEDIRERKDGLAQTTVCKLTYGGHCTANEHKHHSEDEGATGMPQAAGSHFPPHHLHVPGRAGCGMGPPERSERCFAAALPLRTATSVHSIAKAKVAPEFLSR